MNETQKTQMFDLLSLFIQEHLERLYKEVETPGLLDIDFLLESVVESLDLEVEIQTQAEIIRENL